MKISKINFNPIQSLELEDDPSLLTCYLANDSVKAKSENQPDKLVINYRFKRSRPVCEPVQLLAKVLLHCKV